VNTGLPVISGTLQVGSTLSTTNGTWTNNPTSYTYKWSWESNNTWNAIPGATSSTYTIAHNFAGDPLEVTVTAINGFGNTAATSAATGIIPPYKRLRQSSAAPRRRGTSSA
jgi:hypothetical protein